MSTMRNMEKGKNNLNLGITDNYKGYYDQNRKDPRKSRSSSKKRIDPRSGIMIKNISSTKDTNNNGATKNISAGNGSSSNPNLQNLPNNININVNNLIINNNSPSGNNNMGIYPNNYGFYLSNSSVFSKIGSDIINNNNKINANPNSNFGKKFQNSFNPNNNKIMNMNSGLSNTNQTINGVKINFNSLNNILNSNTFNKDKLAQFDNGSSNIVSIKQQNLKYQTNNNKSSLVDNVVNNILENNKKHVNPLNYNSNERSNSSLSNEMVVNSLMNYDNSNNSANSISSANINDQLSHLDISLNKNNNTQGSDSINVVNVTEEVMDRHVYLWDCILELEIYTDNKQTISLASKKLISVLSEEIVIKNLNFDIFSNNILNKTYAKIVKIVIIMLIYFKFILLDFNYENNLKINIKKMITSLIEQLVTLIENFVFNKEAAQEKISKDFLEKYNKIMKIHKTTKKTKDVSNANSLFKNLEIVINNIKQFSNNFFKIGYFKPIHTICFDFLRLIDNYTLPNLMSLIQNNVLFYVLSILNNNQKNGMSSKSVVFPAASFMGVNIVGNITTPFLPQVPHETYTLVLDLDETLVHFFFVNYFLIFLDTLWWYFPY